MLQGQEAGNLYLLSLPDSYPLNPHLHRGWSHVVAPGAVNSPDSMLLARTHHRACTPPADHARRRVRARKEPTEREKVRWGFAKIPFAFMSCRIPCTSPLCALALVRTFAFSHVAGLFALFGESATIRPRSIRGFVL